MVISPVFPHYHHLGRFFSATPASSANSIGSEDQGQFFCSHTLRTGSLTPTPPEPALLALGAGSPVSPPTKSAVACFLVEVQGLLFRMLQRGQVVQLSSPQGLLSHKSLATKGGGGRERGGGLLPLANTTVLQTGSRAGFPTLLPSGPAHPYLSQRGHLYYCAARTRYLFS